MQKKSSKSSPRYQQVNHLDTDFSVLSQVHFLANRIQSTGQASYRKWYGLGISHPLSALLSGKPGAVQPFSWAATVRERERTLHNQRDELWHMRQLSARKSSDQRALGRAACGIGVRVPRARLRPRRRFTDSVVGKTVHRTVFRSSSGRVANVVEIAEQRAPGM
ncbi:hypothetical protein [Paracoccus yeei]|uniref:hypothetical protein n=1 Tax=Paracoccus yeei TaxID=147645 RepID=UPI003BF8BBCF